MKKVTLYSCVFATLTLLPSWPVLASNAVPNPWSVRLGVGRVIFAESADLSVGGAPLPNSGAKVSDNTAFLFAVDYRFLPNFSVELTGGVPPTTTLRGKGVLAGTKLGEVTYAPAVLTAKYHVNQLSPIIVPYVGAGLNYTIVTSAKDAGIANLDVDNAFAFALQVGVEFRIKSAVGVYLDGKWIKLDTTAKGTVGPNAAKADVTLNPLILSAGLGLHF